MHSTRLLSVRGNPSRKSAKKACLVSGASSSSSSGAETGDSDSDGDTEMLLNTSSQNRYGAPISGQLVPPFTAKKDIIDCLV